MMKLQTGRRLDLSADLLQGLWHHVLRALHTDTNFHLPGQSDVCKTLVGTRPGHCFADVIFSYLWARPTSPRPSRPISTSRVSRVQFPRETTSTPLPSRTGHVLLNQAFLDRRGWMIFVFASMLLELQRWNRKQGNVLPCCSPHAVASQ